MQLKATDHWKTSRDGKSALVRVERRDVLSWMKELYPVILVVYDAVRDLACYLVISDYFAGPEVFAKLKGATVTVPVPTENVVSENVLKGRLRRIRKDNFQDNSCRALHERTDRSLYPALLPLHNLLLHLDLARLRKTSGKKYGGTSTMKKKIGKRKKSKRKTRIKKRTAAHVHRLVTSAP